MPGTQIATQVFTVVAQGTIAKGRAFGLNAQQATDGVSSAGVAIMAARLMPGAANVASAAGQFVEVAPIIS